MLQIIDSTTEEDTDEEKEEITHKEATATATSTDHVEPAAAPIEPPQAARKCTRFVKAAGDEEMREQHVQIQVPAVQQKVQKFSSTDLSSELAGDAEAVYIWDKVHETRKAKVPKIVRPDNYPGWIIEYRLRKDSSGDGDIYIKPPNGNIIRSTTKLHEMLYNLFYNRVKSDGAADSDLLVAQGREKKNGREENEKKLIVLHEDTEPPTKYEIDFRAAPEPMRRAMQAAGKKYFEVNPDYDLEGYAEILHYQSTTTIDDQVKNIKQFFRRHLRKENEVDCDGDFDEFDYVLRHQYH